MSPKEKLDIICIRQSPWIKKAKFRQRNRWWLDIVAKIQVKYYILKRKILTQNVK